MCSLNVELAGSPCGPNCLVHAMYSHLYPARQETALPPAANLCITALPYSNDPALVAVQAWDSAIRKALNHKQGKVPANNLARRHPFVLNARIPPRQWLVRSTRATLPPYPWNAVLTDMRRDAGQASAPSRTTRAAPDKRGQWSGSSAPNFVPADDWDA